jgi:hypothetical protein
MLARLIKSGCARRPPVRFVMLVLSEDKMTPSKVAPAGNCDYRVLRIQWVLSMDNVPAFPMPCHQSSIRCICAPSGGRRKPSWVPDPVYQPGKGDSRAFRCSLEDPGSRGGQQTWWDVQVQRFDISRSVQWVGVQPGHVELLRCEMIREVLQPLQNQRRIVSMQSLHHRDPIRTIDKDKYSSIFFILRPERKR